MKAVWLSDKDRVILRGCQINCAIGQMSIEDMRSSLRATEKLDLAKAANDISDQSDEAQEYVLEDAELNALKKLFEEGRKGLPRTTPILKAALSCHDKMEAAKDKEAQ